MLVRDCKMQAGKKRHNVILKDKKLLQLLDVIIAGVPYSTPPLERPEIVCFARRVEELTGYTAEEILADRQLWINMVFPADRGRVFAAFAKCGKCGIPFEINYRIIHKDGSVYHVIDEGEPIFDDKGRITRIEGMITDVREHEGASISDRRKIQEIAEFNSSVNSSVLQRI
jgi:PAS domain S-box-containing protein